MIEDILNFLNEEIDYINKNRKPLTATDKAYVSALELVRNYIKERVR